MSERLKFEAKDSEGLKVVLRFEFNSDVEGMDRFGLLLRVLFDNGYENDVRGIVRELCAAMKKKGSAVPADLEAFGEVSRVH